MTTTTQSMNNLTIAEVCEYLTAEHAARVLSSEAWFAIVPSKDGSFAETGDASAFWALVTQIRELGQPLGYQKKENFLKKLVNEPHDDPELLLRNLIKVQPRMDVPNRDLINVRCKISGQDPEQLYNERKAEYDAEFEAEQQRVNGVIRAILLQQPACGDEPFETTVVLGAFNEETGEYDEHEVTGGEWLVPINRIIDFGERQLKFMAGNRKIPDAIFAAEHALWSNEIDTLKHIVQKQEYEGAGEGSRAIDEALLDAAGMVAGGNAGK